MRTSCGVEAQLTKSTPRGSDALTQGALCGEVARQDADARTKEAAITQAYQDSLSKYELPVFCRQTRHRHAENY